MTSRALLLLLALIACLAGCPDSHGDDGGIPDAGTISDASAPLPDVAVLPDAGRSDVVVSATVPEHAGAVLHVRTWDNSVAAVTPWQTVALDASGHGEVRIAGAIPWDVFGVFVQYFFDSGDGVCEGDPAFEGFVSNAFGDALFVLDADPETASTCASVTRSP